ncbi:uncharacterized protein [Montipora capricornis]|uniref:uncharacterized protein n=1 Tax=Montipora foliosa TaxID=591990 RepID=UPI0035F20F40
MAVGKKYFDSTNLLHLTMALSLLRPDLQGFLGQNTTPPMPVVAYPHNYTGVAFAPSSTSNFNFPIGPKEIVAQGNPFSEFLDWHTASQNQLDTDAVAMLFNGESHAPRETRTSFSAELDSGYCSDGGRSPSALSSVSGSPPHDLESSCGNFQAPEEFNNAGAASGFSLADQDLLKGFDFELEDYIDLDSIYDEPPQKKAFTPEQQSFYPIVKTEPLSPVDAYTRKVPNSPHESYVPTDFIRKDPFEAISLEEPFSFDGLEQLDPYSIDFSATNEEFQESGTQGDAAFDFVSFADNLDYSNDLPLDIFDPRPVVETTVESKHDNLLPLGQEPLPVFSEATATRNDSGGSFTELSSLSQSYTGDWESAPLPLLSSVTVKQEKTDFPDQPASTSTRFTPVKVPRDAYKDARPKVASSSTASRFASEDEIVDMTISEFNTFLETLPEPQAQRARDIRRRGKNKVAARLCRKRKIELVADIEEDIDSLKQKKEEILKERKKLHDENSYYKNKINELQDHLFRSLRDESGKPLSSKEYSLFQGANGSVYVGKNIDSESRKKQ